MFFTLNKTKTLSKIYVIDLVSSKITLFQNQIHLYFEDDLSEIFRTTLQKYFKNSEFDFLKCAMMY